MENQSPVSVTTVEEWKFLTGNKNLVVYFEKKEWGVKREKWTQKGELIWYSAVDSWHSMHMLY